MDRVGETIKRLRKERGWTQAELAHKMNVSAQVISNWERSYTAPDHEDIANLSKIFDVSADVLLGLSAERDDKRADALNRYEPVIREIAERYPDVDLTRPDIKAKLMKLIDVVLEDHRKKE